MANLLSDNYEEARTLDVCADPSERDSALEEFRSILAQQVAHTGVVKAFAGNTRIFAISKDSNLAHPAPMKFGVFDMGEGHVKAWPAVAMSAKTLRVADVEADVEAEIPDGAFIMAVDGEPCLFSKNGLGSLFDECKCRGEGNFDNTTARDLHIATEFYRWHPTVSKSASMIYRWDNNTAGKTVKKIFAVMSGHYSTAVPETCLTFLADYLIDATRNVWGWGDFKQYKVTQQTASFVVVYPDMKEEICNRLPNTASFYPGVRFVTSDTGDASLTASAVLYGSTQKGYVILDEYDVKHSSKLDVEKVADEIGKKLFKGYPELVDTLETLSRVTLLPRGADAETIQKNRERIDKVVSKVLSGTRGYSTIVGNEIVAALSQAQKLSEEGTAVNAADLCSLVFDEVNTFTSMSGERDVRRLMAKFPSALLQVLTDEGLA